ncbi:hypothetical protein ALC53_10515 [Atta colombica]|uniref:Transmembrane protein n=1 Tax=Atta colombica TaxID=520822 RepID=A0A195B396_9HYME|nr:hypothetical protein ALC53_10515 [Atta colombica]
MIGQTDRPTLDFGVFGKRRYPVLSPQSPPAYRFRKPTRGWSLSVFPISFLVMFFSLYPVFRNSFYYELEKTARQRVYNWDADAVNNEALHIPRPSYNEQPKNATTLAAKREREKTSVYARTLVRVFL